MTLRILVLMRGAPGCGKTTWINSKGLEAYALSADKIRGMFASYDLTPEGRPSISQRNDKIVWETLFIMLERRMQRGDFTIIDACNSKTSEMKRYKALADRYRYRIFCIDMTSVAKEEAKRRNLLRPAAKVVPEDYIDRVYSRFETQQIPSGIRRLEPDQFESIFTMPFDLSEYKRVVHIGDIHGCYDALQKMFGDDPIKGIDAETAYIFLGDYGDRGDETPEVLRFLMRIAPLKNVCMLEGNHEAHLWAWANDSDVRSREFNLRTRLQLESAGIQKIDVRKFYRSLRQCSYYTWRGKTVICTHAGLSRIDVLPHIDFIPSCQMIGGVGHYEDMEVCAASFEQQDSDIYQVFGHRNIALSPAMVRPHSIVLEGQVERGGALRTATLDENGWSFSEYVSDKSVAKCIAAKEARTISSESSDAVMSMVEQMRRSRLIVEKKYGHISSFNFSRRAFEDKQWNDLTTRARGLYIDTANMKIAARGYEKFFAVNERPETQLSELARKFEYPLEVFVKENGFLGLVSYDRAADVLLITTKSSPDGDMAELFKSMVSDDLRQRMTEYLKEHDVTMLFEIIHPKADPHIIEYDRQHIYLLDIVDNTLNFSVVPYDDMVNIAKMLGCEYKKKTIEINKWDDFMELYERSQSVLSTGEVPFEGYVIRDSGGFMVKLKTDYYTTWKKLRSVADKVFRDGYIRATSMLSTPLMNYFYAFVKDYYNEYSEHQNIIALRNLYEAQSETQRMKSL